MSIKKQADSKILSISLPEQAVASYAIIGTTPLLQNRMSNKAKQELLYPRGTRLTAADKQAKLKHDPLREYQESAHAPKNKNYETRIIHPARAFVESMATAALTLPSVKKTDILRLLKVEGQQIDRPGKPIWDVPIWGLPQLHMSVVRMSDINRTPDIRTRACLAEWCAIIQVRYQRTHLNAQTVANLLQYSGMTIGIGEDRSEKGGPLGQWTLCDVNDPAFQAIQKYGRAEQDAALENPTFFDEDSRELYEWYETEFARRKAA